MKLPAPLLQTLALAVAGIGVAGCGLNTSVEQPVPSSNSGTQKSPPAKARCDDPAVPPDVVLQEETGGVFDPCPSCGQG